MNGVILASLAVSLVLTLALESGFFFIAGKRNLKDLLLVVMVNILTNPAVVLIYWLGVLYTGLHRAAITIPLELLAVLAEGRCYQKYGNDFKRPYLFSIAANAFSFGNGVIIQHFI